MLKRGAARGGARGGGGGGGGRRTFKKVPSHVPPQPTFAIEELTADLLRANLHPPAELRSGTKGGNFGYLSYHPESKKPPRVSLKNHRLPFPIRIQTSDDPLAGPSSRWSFDVRVEDADADAEDPEVAAAAAERTAQCEAQLGLLNQWAKDTIEARWAEWFPAEAEMGGARPSFKELIKRRFKMKRGADGKPTLQPERDDHGNLIPYKPTFGCKAVWFPQQENHGIVDFRFAGVYDADGRLAASPAWEPVVGADGAPLTNADGTPRLGREIVPEKPEWWRETRFILQVPNPSYDAEAAATAAEAEEEYPEPKHLLFDTLPVVGEDGQPIKCARTGRILARWISPEDVNYNSRIANLVVDVNSLWFVDGKCGLSFTAQQFVFEQSERTGGGNDEEESIRVLGDEGTTFVHRAAPTDAVFAAAAVASRKRGRDEEEDHGHDGGGGEATGPAAAAGPAADFGPSTKRAAKGGAATPAAAAKAWDPSEVTGILDGDDGDEEFGPPQGTELPAAAPASSDSSSRRRGGGPARRGGSGRRGRG